MPTPGRSLNNARAWLDAALTAMRPDFDKSQCILVESAIDLVDDLLRNQGLSYTPPGPEAVELPADAPVVPPTIPPPEVPLDIQVLETQIGSVKETRIMGLVEGKVVGHVGEDFCGDVAQVRELYVADEFQGTGIGRALMKRACQLAMQKQCKVINLSIKRNNATSAFTMYTRLGFRIVAYFGDSDEFAMARFLAPPICPEPVIEPLA